jgi:acyl-CoA thioester hydrolase
MYSHRFQIRVRYSETDKMGYVYYGNYMQYYEVGRVEALRNLGLSYASMEDEMGIFMPVVNMNVRYLRPAYYDELLTLETSISIFPASSIKFYTKIFNEKEELINAAEITLCFVDTKTFKRTDVPASITELLKPYFDKE